MLALLLSALLADPPAAGMTLPAPTGAHAVGTRTLFLLDRSRAPVADEPGRPVTVQLWYPAVPGSGQGPAPYVADESLTELLVDLGYYGQSAATIRAWSALETHAVLGAELAAGELPVLLLSHGLGVARVHYTALAVELASHGYVVATLDHPRGGVTVLADGVVLSTDDDPELEARWEERALEWVADLGFVLDELGRRFPGRLRVERAGVLGHSMGGAAALAAGGRDERIAACADLDGAPLAVTVREGLRRPGLFVKSEPVRSEGGVAAEDEQARRGRPPTGDWAAIAARGSAPVLYTGFRGTGHMSFSDAPFVMPDTITRFGGELVPFGRAHELTCRLLRAFFDQHLRGGPESAVLALDAEPELELFPLAPSSSATR